MEHIEAVIISLLIAVAFLSALATRIGIPYPILLVLGGLALGFVPGIPDVRLEPDLVLVVFLPPLLYSGGFFANLRELRADMRAIKVLEGESLVNDASALVLYRIAVGAIGGGAFSVVDAGMNFVGGALGGFA